jgi:hypothetical protein
MTATDIVQLAALVLPTLVIVLVVVLRYQARRRLLDLIAEAVQAEKPISPETLSALTGASHGPAERDRRRGAMLVAIGLGLALIGVCAGVALQATALGGGAAAAMALAGLGALPLCIGLALIWLSRSQPR